MIHNLGDKTFVLSLLPSDVVTTTGLGSAVDLEDYEGEMAVVLDAEAGGASITYAVKLPQRIRCTVPNRRRRRIQGYSRFTDGCDRGWCCIVTGVFANCKNF
jgi:hypothetical protein